MKLNLQVQNYEKTHEGAMAYPIAPEESLRRSVLSCLLWEREFYEDGETIADRIVNLAKASNTEMLVDLAIEAREKFNLRHVPLLILTVLAQRGGPQVAPAIERVIQRADELAELIAIYWRNGKRPLSAQMKKGLARALRKFDEYALAKYDRAGAVRLRDVLFLTHAKPVNAEQEALWKRLAQNELVTPDTWEVALSGGADKKETFERLLREGQLGYLALIRNLRNMEQAGCDVGLVRDAILARKGARRVLPFRYVAAARAAPMYEPYLDQALVASLGDMEQLSGATAILVDVSGSMDAKLSARSDLTRMDAAATLASIIPGSVRVFTFSNQIVECPPRKGMAGVDAILKSQPHGGTELFGAIQAVSAKIPHDRIIVVTDEQANMGWGGRMPDPVVEKAYLINVASAKNGVGYGKWTHIDGFSESVLRFIGEHERSAA